MFFLGLLYVTIVPREKLQLILYVCLLYLLNIMPAIIVNKRWLLGNIIMSSVTVNIIKF